MSTLVPRELRSWNDPPVHSGWRSFVPVMALDGRVYWQNKKRLELIYQLDEIECASEEDIEELIRLLKDVHSTIAGYLRVRGTSSPLLKKIRLQQHSLASAIDAIQRGYAPGKLPSEADRLALGNSRLQEIGLR